jgi:hypothetical protein
VLDVAGAGEVGGDPPQARELALVQPRGRGRRLAPAAQARAEHEAGGEAEAERDQDHAEALPCELEAGETDGERLGWGHTGRER